MPLDMQLIEKRRAAAYQRSVGSSNRHSIEKRWWYSSGQKLVRLTYAKDKPSQLSITITFQVSRWDNHLCFGLRETMTPLLITNTFLFFFQAVPVSHRSSNPFSCLSAWPFHCISMSLYLLLTKPKGGSQLQHSPFNSFYANMTLTNRQLITIFPLPWHWVCTRIHWAFLCWSSQTNNLILFVSIHPTIPQVNSK